MTHFMCGIRLRIKCQLYGNIYTDWKISAQNVWHWIRLHRNLLIYTTVLIQWLCYFGYPNFKWKRVCYYINFFPFFFLLFCSVAFAQHIANSRKNSIYFRVYMLSIVIYNEVSIIEVRMSEKLKTCDHFNPIFS